MASMHIERLPMSAQELVRSSSHPVQDVSSDTGEEWSNVPSANSSTSPPEDWRFYEVHAFPILLLRAMNRIRRIGSG